MRQPGGPDAPVEVLAVVEAKRNVNDLGHGFFRRQIDLAWLTGDRAAYDPAEHRTGTFDDRPLRPARRPLGGRHAFLFAPVRSTLRPRRVRLLPGRALAGHASRTGLGPVRGGPGRASRRPCPPTRAGTRTTKPKLARLFAWARSLAGPVETPDVVKLYSEPPWAGQIIVMENAFHYSKAAT